MSSALTLLIKIIYPLGGVVLKDLHPLDLHVALALYVVGNALIGRNLAADPKTELESNSYADWIAMYAGESPKM